jgi:hypothetical protein
VAHQSQTFIGLAFCGKMLSPADVFMLENRTLLIYIFNGLKTRKE